MIKNTLLATIFLSLLPFSITIVSKPALANCPPGQVHGLFGVCRRQIYCPDGVATGTNGCIQKPVILDGSKSRITDGEDAPWNRGNNNTIVAPILPILTVTNSCDVPLFLAVKTLNSQNQWEDSSVSLQPGGYTNLPTIQPNQYYLYATSSKGTWAGSDATIYINGQALGMMQRSGSTSITCN